LYIGPKPLHFLLAPGAGGIIPTDIFRVGGAVSFEVSRMGSQPFFDFPVPAPIAVGVSGKPGFVSLAFVFVTTSRLVAGFLYVGGSDVGGIVLAAVDAAVLGGNGVFHGGLLHETLSKRVYIVRDRVVTCWEISPPYLYTI
jgi:hypothetical protein